MVKPGNVRLMVTLQPKTAEKLKSLCEYYDMTYTEIIKLMVTEFHQERIENR